ncbi:MAG: hypothetical protein ACRDFR_00985, partial [Candidatus Limnocylindria bacterium]
ALAGLLLGIPPESGAIHVWLEDVFHGAEELGAGIQPGSILATAAEHGESHGFEPFGLGGLLLLVGASVGVAGILLARRWYLQDPEAPARFVQWIPFGLGPGMYRASVNKYYFDDLYQFLFARGGVVLSNALWWFDVKVIDGAVNGVGWLALRLGGGLRRLQTGRVQNYGLGIAAGLVIVLLVYATVVR